MEENFSLNSPLVSICMPAYNAGKYIVQAINSVINQNYTNWELIIVNDGSTDDTKHKLSQISDERITILHTENQGQCKAANLAFEHSRGNLIKFLDADDLLGIDSIAHQVEMINFDDQIVVGSCWGRFYDDKISTFVKEKNYPQSAKPVEWLLAEMDGKQVMLQCGLWLIPRKILRVSGLWNESLSLINDFEFIIRVLLHAKELRFSSKAILYYRSGIPASLSALKTDDGARSAYESILMGTNYLLLADNSNKARKIVADCFQDFIYAFYPKNMELIALAEKRIYELGGSKRAFPAGGLSRMLSSIIGWKGTKKIKNMLKIG